MNLFQRLTIRSKVILVAMTCTICALSTAVLFSKLFENHKGEQRSIEELTVIAGIIANRSKAALQFDDALLAEQNLAVLSSLENLEIACLYKNRGLFAQFKQLPSQPDCPDQPPPVTHPIIEDHIVISQPVILDGAKIGTLYLKSSQLRLQRLLALYLAVSLGFSGIGAIIALLLASHLQSLITRPIKELHQAASAVQNGQNYEIRARKLSEDEVGGLVEAFNGMLSRIEIDNSMLRESEHRFRTLTAASPFGVFQTDLEGRFFYVNDRWQEITQLYTADADMSSFAKMIHPEDREDTLKMWEDAQEQATEFKAEFRLLNENMKTVSVICQAKPVLDNDNRIAGFLGSLADISELKLAQSQLEKLALYDPLTTLANRHLFRNRLEKAIRSAQRNKQKFALMFLDFDEFKRVNDTLGHDQGDELLVAMAKRLRTSIRAKDTVARMGGDEFTILIPDVEDRHDVDLIARKILAHLREPVILMGQEVILTCSIGITVCPDDGRDANQLMKNADMAMYRSKKRGRDGFYYFSEEINEQISNQLKIENALRHALSREELEIYYQPKVTLDSETPVGYEALIRWNHPNEGLLGPGHFISVAEDTGQIIGIGKWIFQDVCKKIKDMLQCGLLPPDGRVSVNLSVKQFRDTNLVADISKILDQHEVSPRYVELEITESTLMEDVDKAIFILAELRKLGFVLSIDDFGTGYSSFNYLKRLPIDLIKVDRSFVADIPHDKDDMEITGAVIAMAHKLRLEVVAEGVETEAQKDFLRENGCDYAQGYLFGKPQPYKSLKIPDESRDKYPKTS
ncbi:MAG: EAL domain-containing protein [Ketobacteraceae bacterium]|nr:EAL domain-containing protein [Ketobacteraceae bacterium]